MFGCFIQVSVLHSQQVCLFVYVFVCLLCLLCLFVCLLVQRRPGRCSYAFNGEVLEWQRFRVSPALVFSHAQANLCCFSVCVFYLFVCFVCLLVCLLVCLFALACCFPPINQTTNQPAKQSIKQQAKQQSNQQQSSQSSNNTIKQQPNQATNQ